MHNVTPVFVSFSLIVQQPLLGHSLFLSRLHIDTYTFPSTPLDDWSAWRRGLYLTTHNIHKKQTSMLPAGLEPEIPAIEWLQADALDRAAAGIGV